MIASFQRIVYHWDARVHVHLTAFAYHPTTCQCNPRSRISWRNIRKARRQARILHETNVHLRNKLAEPAEELARPGHFCDSSRTITMNHRTRSTVKSLELAGNEKSRLDRLAILSLLFYSSSERQPSACVVPPPSALRNSSGKSEPQSGASSWLGKQNISWRTRLGLSPFALRLSSQPILHPPPRHFSFGKSGPRNCVGGTTQRRSIRKVKLLGEINNSPILSS